MDDRRAAKLRYDNLNTYADLEALIQEGETEDLFYECKAPTGPKVSPDIKAKLAQALSGYSNTEGGIIFYGIETSKLAHSESDTMIQITRVGTISNFSKKITNTIPTLTMPAVTRFEHKIIKAQSHDTAGVLVVFIPPSQRPVQSLIDNKFYFRGGDQFVLAPYTVIERLFSSTTSPDMTVTLDQHKSVQRGSLDAHQFSVLLRNDSLAVGKEVTLWMELKNPENTSAFEVPNMRDISEINNKKRVYIGEASGVVHNKLGLALGNMTVTMKPNKHKLVIEMMLYAENMAPRKYIFTCLLNKKTLGSIDRELIT